MSPNPNSFLDHLRENFYHPRSDKHSNVLSGAIVGDLITQCRGIREKASRGEIVYDLNFDLIVARAVWNIDLVLGHPGPAVAPPPGDQAILKRRPSTVEIAIEIKSIMTEHRKAVKNRNRDLEAHHEHVHNYNSLAIAGGVFVINASPTFRSPLRPGLTMHRNPLLLVEHCIAELRSVATRGGPTGYGLEAQCAVVVSMDNIHSATVKYVTTLPAPQVGDPLHYDAFVRRICHFYEQRFA